MMGSRGLSWRKRGLLMPKSAGEKRHVGLHMEVGLADTLRDNAKSMRVSKSSYCVEVLRQWIESQKKLEFKER